MERTNSIFQVNIADFANLKPDTPEVLSIGEVHGNEKVGTSVVNEMAKLLVTAHQFPTDPQKAELLWLVWSTSRGVGVPCICGKGGVMFCPHFWKSMVVLYYRVLGYAGKNDVLSVDNS